MFLNLGFKEAAKGTKEISKQIESYEFQVKAMAWQIMISLSITLAMFFLGAGRYDLFFAGLLIGLFFFAVVLIDYRKITLSIISRERGMSVEELERFRRLMKEGRYDEAVRLVKSLNGMAEGQKSEFVNTIRLSRRLGKMVSRKRMGRTELRRIAKSKRIDFQGEYYKMSASELSELIKGAGRAQASSRRKQRF